MVKTDGRNSSFPARSPGSHSSESFVRVTRPGHSSESQSRMPPEMQRRSVRVANALDTRRGLLYCIINMMLLSILLSVMISGGAPCIELCACWESSSRCNGSSACLLSLSIIAHPEYYQHDDYCIIVLYYQYNIIIHVIVDNCCRRSSGHPLPAARRRRGAGPARPAVAAHALGGDYKNKTLLYFY